MAYATITDIQLYNANIDVSDAVETQRLLDRASEWVDGVITCPPTSCPETTLKMATLAIVEAYAAGTEMAQVVGGAGGDIQIGSFRIGLDMAGGVPLPQRAVNALRLGGCLNNRVGWH